MIEEDLRRVRDALSRITDPDVKNVLLLSPNWAQYMEFRKAFPHAAVHCVGKYSWNISRKHRGTFDLIFAGNVLMYSPAPLDWFKNILACCRLFLVQDLISRRRSDAPPYLGEDHDTMRFQFAQRGVISSFPAPFDLENVPAICADFVPYDSGDGALHYWALFQNRSIPTAPGRRIDCVNLWLGSLWFHLSHGGFGRK